MSRRASLASLACALLLAGSVCRVSASGAPRFDLDECTWSATHVVVATEGPSIDGIMTLLETVAGPLASDDKIRLPRLSKSALAASRRTHEGRRVSGTRMVLFLSLKRDSVSKTWACESPLTSESVCWIEGGKGHAMIGRGSRAGALIGPLRLSEQALRARVLHLVAMRSALARLRKTANVEQRLAGVANYVNADDRFAAREVFDVLGSCGKAAIPLLVSHLDGPLRHRACRALGAIGDTAAVRPLVQRVERELVFWRDAKQRLVHGSWQRTSKREMQLDDARVRRLHTLLYTLKQIPSPDYLDVVRRTRKLWTEPPALREIPYGYIVRACDAALRAVDERRAAAK